MAKKVAKVVAEDDLPEQVKFWDEDIGYNVLCAIKNPDSMMVYQGVCYASIGHGNYRNYFNQSTELVAYYFYSPNSPLSPEQYERYWNEVVIPSVPDRLQKYVKLEELGKEEFTKVCDEHTGSTTDKMRRTHSYYSLIPWKKITFDTAKCSFDDFFVLGVLARQVCEYSTHWVEIFAMEEKYPEFTLEQLSFIHMSINGDGHTFWASASLGATATPEQVKAYSTKGIFEGLKIGPPLTKENKKSILVNSTFSVSEGTGLNWIQHRNKTNPRNWDDEYVPLKTEDWFKAQDYKPAVAKKEA